MVFSVSDLLMGLQQGEPRAVMAVAAVYFLACALFSLLFQWRVRQWPAVWGDLHQQGLEVYGTDNLVAGRDYRAQVLYTYTVQDKVYEGSRLSPWLILASHHARLVLMQQMRGITRDDHGQVKVFYHPRKPHKSYLIVPGVGGMLVTVFFGVFPLVLYGLKFGG